MQFEGAIYYQGVGHHGSSYAIPTKDFEIKTLSVWWIRRFVTNFLVYALDHPELTFHVTKIGCGLAGFKEKQIAPFFKLAPLNCHLPKGWRTLNDQLEDGSEWSSLHR